MNSVAGRKIEIEFDKLMKILYKELSHILFYIPVSIPTPFTLQDLVFLYHQSILLVLFLLS